LTLTFIGGFHEGIKFERLFGGDLRLAGTEHLHVELDLNPKFSPRIITPLLS
jgi:hypothetical protein